MGKVQTRREGQLAAGRWGPREDRMQAGPALHSQPLYCSFFSSTLTNFKYTIQLMALIFLVICIPLMTSSSWKAEILSLLFTSGSPGPRKVKANAETGPPCGHGRQDMDAHTAHWEPWLAKVRILLITRSPNVLPGFALATSHTFSRVSSEREVLFYQSLDDKPRL